MPRGIGRREVLAGMGVMALAPLFIVGANTERHRPTVEVAPGLDIVPRKVWGAGLEPTGPMPPETVQFLLVHHTAGPNQYSADSVAEQLRGVYRFHTGPEKKWPDVCYNFFVDRYGVVWEGRDGSIAGPVTADATGGSQGFAQLVCLLGDFTSIMPTPEALASTVRVLAWMADRYGLDTTPGATATFVSRGSNRWPAGDVVTALTVSGHRDMTNTACPGDTLYPVVHDDMQRLVTQVRSTSSGTTPPTTVESVPPTDSETSTSEARTSDAVVTTTASPPTTTSQPSSTSSEPAETAPASPTSAAPDANTTMTTTATASTGIGADPADEDDSVGSASSLVALGVGGVALAGATAVRLRRLRDGESKVPEL